MKHEPEVNLDLAIEHGLNEEEYNQILKILDRVPTYTELEYSLLCGVSIAAIKILCCN